MFCQRISLRSQCDSRCFSVPFLCSPFPFAYPSFSAFLSAHLLHPPPPRPFYIAYRHTRHSAPLYSIHIYPILIDLFIHLFCIQIRSDYASSANARVSGFSAVRRAVMRQNVWHWIVLLARTHLTAAREWFGCAGSSIRAERTRAAAASRKVACGDGCIYWMRARGHAQQQHQSEKPMFYIANRQRARERRCHRSQFRLQSTQRWYETGLSMRKRCQNCLARTQSDSHSMITAMMVTALATKLLRQPHTKMPFRQLSLMGRQEQTMSCNECVGNFLSTPKKTYSTTCPLLSSRFGLAQLSLHDISEHVRVSMHAQFLKLPK